MESLFKEWIPGSCCYCERPDAKELFLTSNFGRFCNEECAQKWQTAKDKDMHNFIGYIDPKVIEIIKKYGYSSKDILVDKLPEGF